jgi:hypothetical protein
MSSATQPRLESAIRAALAPTLTEDGFRGSGRKFHRELDSWLQVITVQGSRWGGSFAVNLGIHFSGAPDVIGRSVVPSKMTEAECEFRRRLSEGMTDQWWKHEGDHESMLLAVQSAAVMYKRFGRGYFSQALVGLNSVTPDDLVSGTFDFKGFGNTKVRLGLALARIRRLQELPDQSKGFAAYALQHIGSASFLRSELEALAANDAHRLL